MPDPTIYREAMRAAITTAIPLIEAQERARIVAWLRDHERSPLGKSPAWYADAIEQGKHHDDT